MTVIVPPELAGERIDKALAALVPELSRHVAKKVIDMGGVFSGTRRVRRASDPVRAGDVLEATWHPEVLVPERFELVVIHEDADVVVVEKPSGQLSQGSELGDVGSLIWALTRRFGRAIRLMHRLDKGASGVMLAARNARATAALTPQFREHAIERRYLAVTSGVPAEGRCAIPIAKEKGAVRAAREGEDGMPALSEVRVVAQHEGRALVEVQIFTGRTHQIRIHLASLGAPVVGDDTYGGPPAERLCLHAAVLGFVHPDGRAMRFERSPGDDFAKASGGLAPSR